MELRLPMPLPTVFPSLSPEDMSTRWQARKLRGLFSVDDETYHLGPGISSTGVKVIAEKSPAHYKHMPKPNTRALKRGRAMHEALFQPEVYASLYAHEPESIWGMSKTTNPAKKIWDEFKARCKEEGKEYILQEESLMIQGILKNFDKSDIWQQMREEARYEVAAFHQVAIGNVPILTKAKADILLPYMISDLKTCLDGSPEAASKVIAQRGYHISAAYYLDCFNASLDLPITSFTWIFAETSPPYALSFYPASAEMLRVGRMEYQRALQLYGEALATGVWPGYKQEFVDIELPSYYLRKFQ